MAISQAVCNSFKKELLESKHDFANGGDTFKIALFTSSASLGATTTAYSTSNEITNTSGSAYTAGGETLTGQSVTGGSSASTAFVDFSNKFCFSSESFMKTFALALYDSNIPFVVYSNGHIGYRIEDSAQVQKVGDKLVHDYLSNRKK